MKFSAIFLLAACLQVSAKSYSQRVTFSIANAPVSEAFKEINKQTGFDFLFTDEMVKGTDGISVSLKNTPLRTALDECLKDLPLEYTILEKTVVIKRKIIRIPTPEAPVFIEAVITGTIKDENGAPLSGATVRVKGGKATVITNDKGEFTIQANPDDKLEFSFVGYESQELAIDGRASLLVALKQSVRSLDETVVVGYGSQKKINLTGAVSSINFESKEMQSRPLVNVSTALTGMAPGMNVVQSTGNPQNNAATINIRGTGSLNQGSEPLIIIDGQPGDMNVINPNDVASVSVLKDASSAAIYGSRAANGVILITTKMGRNTEGKVTFEYNGYAGRTAPTKLFDLVTDVGDHMELMNHIQTNSGVIPSFTQERIDEWRTKSKTDPILFPNTNWYDVIIKPNTISSHTFSARGGNDKINFYSSFGILDNNGVVPKSGVTRYNFRNNLMYKVNNWLKFGNTMTGNFYKHPPDLTQSIFIVYPNPSVLPKAPDGRYGVAMSGGIDSQAGNLLQEIEDQRGQEATQNYTGKLYTVISPLPGLDVTASYFLDASTSNGWRSNYPSDKWNFQTETKVGSGSAYGSTISNSFSKTERKVIDIYATYNKSFKQHTIKLVAGYNQEKWDNTWFSASKAGLISNDLPVLDAASYLPNSAGSGSAYRMRSYFGRVGYDFANKYLFEANLRYDGSSKFSPENRWGLFPSFSAGWIA
ncbi:MAG: SusC/RagA family TonB-linked outer membrane protein, partial [Flavitalea sp.]